jgi:hypothetical protein
MKFILLNKTTNIVNTPKIAEEGNQIEYKTN